ncbi:MAG: hypothetical protein AABY32_01210 [Nanoarchaeota archaeon]
MNAVLNQKGKFEYQFYKVYSNNVMLPFINFHVGYIDEGEECIYMETTPIYGGNNYSCLTKNEFDIYVKSLNEFKSKVDSGEIKWPEKEEINE